MKILKIDDKKITGLNRKMVNSLLNRGMFNDYVMDHQFIEMTVEPDNPIDCMYRQMWETIYTHLGYSSYNYKTKQMTLTISLSEAVQFIHNATPPRLKHLVKDALKSIDDIMTLLKQYLMDDNGGHQITYLSMFKKIMRVEPYETVWEYDTTPILVLRQQGNPNNLVGAIIGTSVSVKDLITNDDVHDIPLQMLFHYQNDGQLNALFRIISNFNKDICFQEMYVLNIKQDDEGGRYIMMYSPRFSNNNKEFKEFLETRYSEFLKYM